MRKHGVVLAMIALLVAAWGASASALNSPKVFSLLEVSGQTLPVNGFAFQRAPVGGDQFGFVDTLYKWAGTKRGARAGRVQGLGTFVTVGAEGGTIMFVGQAYLQGGTVLVQGYAQFPANGPSTFTLPVVGGTGIYDNVRGYVKVRDLGNGNQDKQNLEFHLLP